MAELVVLSREGETVDAVVWRAVAGDAEAVEAVLAFSPGLAALGPILPPGTRVTIPAATGGATLPLIQLWD